MAKRGQRLAHGSARSARRIVVGSTPRRKTQRPESRRIARPTSGTNLRLGRRATANEQALGLLRSPDPIPEAPGETWRAVDGGLRVGVRGLPSGSSLAQLLDEHRGRRNLRELPPFTVRKILAWADAHHKRTGVWPTNASGPIAEAPHETWSAVGVALANGRRGLPGRSSLSKLLAIRRAVYYSNRLRPLSLAKMRGSARAYKRASRAVGLLQPPVRWRAFQARLGRTSATLCAKAIVGFLAVKRWPYCATARRRTALFKFGFGPLTDEQVLAWADAHLKRTGRWPHSRSGAIAEAPGETWRSVDRALHTGTRGLTRKSTLVRFLAERRAWRIHPYTPALNCQQILAWADAHHRRTGAWPNQNSGPVLEAPGETWRAVDDALRLGARRLRVRTCLARLLAEKRGIRNRTNLPRLTHRRIWSWAKKHHRRTALWPTAESGPVVDAPGETWKAIDMALRHGCRGFPVGFSLARLLAERRGVKPRGSRVRAVKPFSSDVAWVERTRETHRTIARMVGLASTLDPPYNEFFHVASHLRLVQRVAALRCEPFDRRRGEDRRTDRRSRPSVDCSADGERPRRQGRQPWNRLRGVGRRPDRHQFPRH